MPIEVNKGDLPPEVEEKEGQFAAVSGRIALSRQLDKRGFDERTLREKAAKIRQRAMSGQADNVLYREFEVAGEPWAYKWMRIKIHGVDDPVNIQKTLTSDLGWHPVPATELPDGGLNMLIRTGVDGNLDFRGGVVQSGDLVLCRAPRILRDAHKEGKKAKADQLYAAVKESNRASIRDSKTGESLLRGERLVSHDITDRINNGDVRAMVRGTSIPDGFLGGDDE